MRIHRMERGLRGRQLENQPTAADVDRPESEHVGEEPAVRFRVGGGEKEVSASEHSVPFNV